ncbi:MAG: glycosyltransferase family 2 protein [Alphaproteobacteria bacterium]|nr:glycosyltransferase family 2 protein [Alphaproteobacteria bacterium]
MTSSSSSPLNFRKLSVIIPCYNEIATIETVIGKALAADRSGLEIEILCVDDGSRDGTDGTIERLARAHPEVRLLRHTRNQGKGAALRTGFSSATGDILLVQDADLEYSPADYPKLLKPIIDGRADVVFGSRFRSSDEVRVIYFWHDFANRVLTFFSNMMTNLNLTDMETGYKVFRREVISKVAICENRFGFEPEITAKIARLRPAPRIYEVGISYSGRTYEEGKKIGFKDGIRAIWCILRYNLFP